VRAQDKQVIRCHSRMDSHRLIYQAISRTDLDAQFFSFLYGIRQKMAYLDNLKCHNSTAPNALFSS